MESGYRKSFHLECPECPDGNPSVTWRNKKLQDDLWLTKRASELLDAGDAAVLSATWWHTTGHETGFDQTKVEHVGTRDAALHRVVSTENIGKRRDLYSLELKQGVTILPEVVVELNGPGIEGAIRFRPTLKPATVLRYVNSQEAPGDISLLLGPDSIRISRFDRQVICRAIHINGVRVGEFA